MGKRTSGLSFYKKKKKLSKALIKEIFVYLFGSVVAFLCAFALIYLFGMKISVVGTSMEDTLKSGQEVLIDRFVYLLTSPKRGDVVCFLPNGNENSHYYIKRVVAVPGDSVWINNGTLYVNGKESKLLTANIVDPGIAKSEYTLNSNEYFCIGDNPTNSEDSRSANIGAVSNDYIIGKAWFKLSFLKNRFGFIK